MSTEGLLDLGLLRGDLKELIASEAYKPFSMHRAGHWLGMDVHDVGDYKVHDEWRVLEPGMVMTVEPGIYIAPDNENVAAKWRGIGIRIEDDVLVTALSQNPKGHEVLTHDVVKTVDEIHALMQPASNQKVVDPAQMDFISTAAPSESEAVESDDLFAPLKTESKAKSKAKGKAKAKTKEASKKSAKVKKVKAKKAKTKIKNKPGKKSLSPANKKLATKKKSEVKKKAVVKKKKALKKKSGAKK